MIERLQKSGHQALRVGLFGVGFEQDGKTSRMRWYEMDTIELEPAT